MTSGSLDSTTVAEALARHYAEHGLPSDGGESERWFHMRIGPLVLPLPNPPARRRVVLYHDVNHILTGYNTVFSEGEMAIAGYELGSGCGPFWIAWLINLGAFALGLVVCPQPMFKAFLRGRRAASVYRCEDTTLLREMAVTDLSTILGIVHDTPEARISDRLTFLMWSLVAGTFVAIPVLAGFAAWTIVR